MPNYVLSEAELDLWTTPDGVKKLPDWAAQSAPHVQRYSPLLVTACAPSRVARMSSRALSHSIRPAIRLATFRCWWVPVKSNC